jgi:hypothetical protein
MVNAIMPFQIFTGESLLLEFFLAKNGAHFTSTTASANSGHCFSR